MKLEVLTLLFLVCVYADVGSMRAAQLNADLSDFSGQGLALEAMLYDLEPKMASLYYLCRQDIVCSSRFYLAASASTEPTGNDAARQLQAADENSDQKKFYRILVLWAQRDDCPLRENALRPRITISDYQEADAMWWLTVMNTVRICSDNQVWETSQGCVAKPDYVDDNGDPVHVRAKLDVIGQPIAVLTIAVFSLLILGAITASVYIVNKAFKQMVQYMNASHQLWRGMAPGDSVAMPIDNELDNDEAINQLQVAEFVAHAQR